MSEKAEKDDLLFEEPEAPVEPSDDTEEIEIIPANLNLEAWEKGIAGADEDPEEAPEAPEAPPVKVEEVKSTPEIDEVAPESIKAPVRVPRVTRRMSKVLDHLEEIIGNVANDDDIRNKALQAAKLLNKIVDRNHDESEFKVGNLLTGDDPYVDAAVLEAWDIKEAIDDDWDFTEVVEFAWDAAKFVLDGIKTIRIIFGG